MSDDARVPAGFALTARRALQLPPEAIILHPDPWPGGHGLRGRSCRRPVTDQVGNGVAVRMAGILLLGHGSLEGAAWPATTSRS